MKIIDERETQKKKTKTKNRTRGTKAIVKEWGLNGFVVRLS